MSGDGTYNGDPKLDGGTTILQSNTAFGANGVGLLMTNQAMLDLYGFSPAIGTLTLIDGYIGNSGSSGELKADNFVVENGGIDANLVGKTANATLTKITGNQMVQSDTVILNGMNNYHGCTTVYGGTLELSANARTPLLAAGYGGASICNGHLIFDYANPADETAIQQAVTNQVSNHMIYSDVVTTPVVFSDDAPRSRATVSRAMPGDANCNGAVTSADLNLLISNYGGSGKTWSQGDFNGDGLVNADDFNLLLANYNTSPTWVDVPPNVVGIFRLGSQVISDNSLLFVVVFNEPVSGVDATDFRLARTGMVSNAVTILPLTSNDVYGGGAVYLVTVNNVFGTGTLGLNLVDDDSIHEVGGGLCLGGSGTTGPGDGSFTGQVYTTQSPFVWTGQGNGEWRTPGNWLGNAVPATGESLLFPAGPTGLAADNDFLAGTNFRSIELAANYTISGNDLVLTNGITVDKNVTGVSVSANIALDGSISVDVGANASLTLSGVLSDDGAATGTLLKTGGGTLAVTNNNGYSGGTTISAGSFYVGDGGWTTTGTLGSGTASVVNYGSLVFNRRSDMVVANPVSGSGGIVKDGPGLLVLTGANNYSGRTFVAGGILELGSSAQNPILTGGGTDIQAGKIVFDYTGVAFGVGSLVSASYDGGRWDLGHFHCTTHDNRHGLGWLNDTVNSKVTVMFTLCGDADLDGTVNGADLSIELANYSRTGMTWSQGDFNYDGIIDGADLSLVVSNYCRQIPPSSQLLWSPQGLPVWDTSTKNWLDGNGNRVCWDNNAGYGALFDGSVGTTVEISGTIIVNSIHFNQPNYVIEGSGSNALLLPDYGILVRVGNGGSDILRCPLTGGGALLKDGPGTLILEGNNTYSGSTAINEGTLQVGNGGAAGNLGANAVDAVMAGASLVFDLNGQDIVFNYPIVGSGSLVKNGANKLTLGAASNYYTGATTVNAGELCVNGSLASSPVIVNSGSLSGAGATGSLELVSGSSLRANLSDGATDCVRVNGTAKLDGATLNGTSNRTSSAGTVWILIENDGADAVDGTFSGLPENMPVTIGSQTYFITYRYNAEAGQFDTGNDVALASTLFSTAATAASSYITNPATVEMGAHVIDATAETDTSAVESTQYQLVNSISQHDLTWKNGSPAFSYSSSNESIATVDGDGLVTFWQPGQCTFLVTATKTGYAPQTFAIQLSGNVWGGVVTRHYKPDPFNASDPRHDASQYVLVLYNADSTDSTALMNYYQANRPGVSNANYLPISAMVLTAAGYNLGGISSLPDTAGTSYASEAICDAIAGYVNQWVRNSALPIRCIVGLCGLPSRVGYSVGDGGTSVSYMIHSALQAGTGKPDYSGAGDQFSVAEYGAPLVAWLDCGSYANTYAYITKDILAANSGGLQNDGITISGTDADINGNTWILDDVHHGLSGYQDYFGGLTSNADYTDALSQDGVSNIIYNSNNQLHVISSATDPTAYGSWGEHSGELRTGNSADAWPCSGDRGPAQVTFAFTNSLHIGWWIGMSVESYNGIYGDYQGDPTEFFAPTAFGGTAQTLMVNGIQREYYTNTPICWVGSTAEPTLIGCEGSAYFSGWATGLSTLESAWAGRRTPYFLAVTDIYINP